MFEMRQAKEFGIVNRLSRGRWCVEGLICIESWCVQR